MNHFSNRLPAIASQVLLQSFRHEANQTLAKRISKPWVCELCSRNRFLSTASKRAQKPPARLIVGILRVQSRGFSICSKLRDASKTRDDLPSQEEGRRSHASKRFDHLMDNLQSNIFIAGQRLNDLTGYSGIDALKKDIEQQEIFVQATRASLQRARDAYTKAISQRSTSQREVNELLQRKHAWTPTDLERFTELYRSDHANEQAESAAQDELVRIEKTAEDAAAQLSRSILARYHEEQIWSDKIRRMSTWGTWGLMGVNVLLFLVFQIGVEPWRRKRLVKGFEEKVVEALEREGSIGRLETIGVPGPENAAAEKSIIADLVVEGGQTVLTDTPILDTDPALAKEELAETFTVGVPIDSCAEISPPLAGTSEPLQGRIRDLFSERQISLRRVDLTIIALEGVTAGVTAGVAFFGLLLLLTRPR